MFQEQKVRVEDLEKQYQSAKTQYASSLQALEKISEEIHTKRQQSGSRTPIGEREDCIGAESLTPKTIKQKTSLAKAEEKIQAVISDKKSVFKTGKFRSSLLLDLDVDIDLDGVDFVEPQRSPSTKSVDIGCINRKTSEEFEVLDISSILTNERPPRKVFGAEPILEVFEAENTDDVFGITLSDGRKRKQRTNSLPVESPSNRIHESEQKNTCTRTETQSSQILSEGSLGVDTVSRRLSNIKVNKERTNEVSMDEGSEANACENVIGKQDNVEKEEQKFENDFEEVKLDSSLPPDVVLRYKQEFVNLENDVSDSNNDKPDKGAESEL